MKWAMILMNFAAIMAARAAPPLASQLPSCLEGRVPFSLREQFPAPKTQFSGTCYAEAAMATFEAALYRESGRVHALSTEVALCDWMQCARPEDMASRVKKVCQPYAQGQAVDGGFEEIVLGAFAHQPISLVKDSAELRRSFRSAFEQLTAGVRNGSIRDVAARNAYLASAKARIRRESKPSAALVPKETIDAFERRDVVPAQELFAIRHQSRDGKAGPANAYLKFVTEIGHPAYLRYVFRTIEGLLTPDALKRWKGLHGMNELRAFGEDMKRDPGAFLKSHRRRGALTGADAAEAAGEPLSVRTAERIASALFERSSDGTVYGDRSLVSAFERAKVDDFQNFLPSVEARYRKLVQDCDVAAASVRRQVLHYLCAGIPVLSGMDLPGVEVGSERGVRKPARVKGVGLHAMVIQGVGAMADGKTAFLYRNSQGEGQELARSAFQDACQLQQLSVYLTPKDKLRLKTLYGAEISSSEASSSH